MTDNAPPFDMDGKPPSTDPDTLAKNEADAVSDRHNENIGMIVLDLAGWLSGSHGCGVNDPIANIVAANRPAVEFAVAVKMDREYASGIVEQLTTDPPSPNTVGDALDPLSRSNRYRYVGRLMALLAANQTMWCMFDTDGTERPYTTWEFLGCVGDMPTERLADIVNNKVAEAVAVFAGALRDYVIRSTNP